jgi:hypothetical protein
MVDQLRKFRDGRPAKKKWGTTGARNFGEEVKHYLIKRPRYETVLDFGAGEGGLGSFICESIERRSRAPEIKWTNYDPGVPGIDKLPSQRFDLIVSSDVLEHVEPEMIDQTCEWLRDHASKALYMHIACDPAGLRLPDGRNVHLITEKMDWWIDKLMAPGWTLMYCHDAWQMKRSGLRNHCHIMMEYTGAPGEKSKPDKMKFYADQNGLDGEKPRPYTARYVPDLPLDQVNGRLIRNPNYGGDKAGIYGWCTHAKVSMGKKPLFMEALGESLREEGYRNPIICYATETGNWLSFGGSRVLCGRNVGLRTVPCIVNDYCGRFKDYPEVTEENFASFFTDVPRWHVIDELGVDYHYAIERKRRSEYDPAGHAWCDKDAHFMKVEFPWIGEGLTRDPLPRAKRTERSKYLRERFGDGKG